MPVVLGPEPWTAWLGEEPADLRQLKVLLAPFPSKAMTCWHVSARVGNVKNNEPSLIEPLTAAELGVRIECVSLVVGDQRQGPGI
jgi:putative SOS response-associated peptidase YedK